MTGIIVKLLLYLLLTIVLEISLAFILKVRGKDLLYVVLVNVITNPLVNAVILFVCEWYGFRYYLVTLLIMELIAYILEAVIYLNTLDYKKLNPFLLSLILNGFSFLIGLLI